MSSSNEQNIPQLSVETNPTRALALAIMANLKLEIDLLRSHKSDINRLIQTVKEDKPIFLMETLTMNEARLREARTDLNLWIQQNSATRVKPQVAEEEVSLNKFLDEHFRLACIRNHERELVADGLVEDTPTGVSQMYMDREELVMYKIEDDVMAIAEKEFTHSHEKDLVELQFEFAICQQNVPDGYISEFHEAICDAYEEIVCEKDCKCRPGCLPNA